MQQRIATGFTLLELSIVLVVIGLLVGGVLVGRDLIHTAELRSVVTQIEKYDTAVMAFLLKYSCLPGDCPKAVELGLGDAACDPNDCGGLLAIPHAGCNGNDDGLLAQGGEGPICRETFNFWFHLREAGLIGDPVDGKSTMLDTDNGEPFLRPVYGRSAPVTKLSDTGVLVGSYNLHPYVPSSTTYYVLGQTQDTANNAPCCFLTPAEAHYIDTKRDDGAPLSGKVVAPEWVLFTQCVASGAYNLAADNRRCYLFLRTAGFAEGPSD